MTVVDREGNPVRGLTAANFRGRLRGKAVQIDAAVYDAGPRRMVILLDASGSMRHGNEWDATRLLAFHAAHAHSGQLRLALIIFASKLLEVHGFEVGNEKVLARLKGLLSEKFAVPRNRGLTAVYDALGKALELLTPAFPGDVVYALTDGVDNTSKLKSRPLEDQFLRQEARLFATVPAEAGPMMTPEDGRSRERFLILRQIIRSSGGGQLNLFSLSDASTVYWWNEDQKSALLNSATRLYDQMRMTYRVTVRLPSDPDKTWEWDLQFVDYQGKGRDDWAVLYPRKLLPRSQLAVAPVAPK